MKDIKILNSENGQFYGDFNDFSLGENHDLVVVENSNKIAQDVVKILFTLKGSSPLFKNYGTSISKLINTRGSENVDDKIREEILYALSYVQKINENEKINISEIIKVNIVYKVNNIIITLVLRLTNGQVLQIEV